jgi:hypothetical protein
MSSGTLSAATSDTGGGRAFRPGPRWAFGVAAAVIVLVAIGVVVLTSSGGGASAAASAARNANTSYGKLPSWLPKYRASTTKLEVATVAKPILSEEQGFTVHAELPSGAADITAVGPEIPAYVSNYVQKGVWQSSHRAPGTFIVSVDNVSGTVPLSTRAFSILTNSGQIVHPVVSVKGGGRLPPVLHAGQRINLKVTGGVYEGVGSIRWAPLGRSVLVGWLYQLELD